MTSSCVEAIRYFGHAIHCVLRLLGQPSPKFDDARTSCWKHAVLQTVEVLPVYWRNKASGSQTKYNTGRKVVLADAVAKLEVLIEHGS